MRMAQHLAMIERTKKGIAIKGIYIFDKRKEPIGRTL